MAKVACLSSKRQIADSARLAVFLLLRCVSKATIVPQSRSTKGILGRSVLVRLRKDRHDRRYCRGSSFLTTTKSNSRDSKRLALPMCNFRSEERVEGKGGGSW